MAILASTPIPTANGWVLARDLQQDDIVFDQDGCPQKVLLVQEYTPRACFSVELDDGLTLEGDSKLTLRLETRKYRNRVSEYQNRTATKYRKQFRRPLVERQAQELHNNPLTKPDGRLEYSVPNCLPVQYATRDLPVPPYVFGIWIACVTPRGRMWLRDKPLNRMRSIFRTYGFSIVTRKHKNGLILFDIRPSVRDSFLFAGHDIPKDLPVIYTDGSIEQRIELLKGLIDGGAIQNPKKGQTFIMREANYHYIRKVQGVVESLGIKTTLYTPSGYSYYTLKFNTSLLFNDEKPKKSRFTRRFVKNVVQIDPKPCIHIETPNQILVGEGYIPVC